MNPLIQRVGRPPTFRNHQPHKCVVIPRLNTRFTRPSGEVHPCAVLRLNHNAVTVESDTADVATVFGPAFNPTVDAVVIEGVG
jgi:hypothetical protein